MAFGRHYHPIWTMVASVALVAGGTVLLRIDYNTNVFPCTGSWSHFITLT